MLRDLMILWLCLSSVGDVFAQTMERQIDSLEVMLQNAQPGLDRLDVLLGLTRQHMLLGEDSIAMAYAQLALKIAQDFNSKEEQANCLNFVSQIQYNDGVDYYSTVRKAMEVAKSSGSKDAIGFTTYIWVEFGDYSPDRGIEMLEEVLQDSTEISPKNLGNIYKAIAWEYEKNGRFADAETAYLNSIRIFESYRLHLPVDPRLGRVSAQYIDRGISNLMQSHLYLGGLYMKLGDFNGAIREGENGVQIAEGLSEFDLAYAHMYLGDFFATAGNVSDALDHYKLTEKEYLRSSTEKWKGRILTRIGSLYLTMRDYNQAIRYFTQAYEIHKSTPEEAADLSIRLGSIFESQEDLELAMKMYQRGDSLYLSIGDSLSSIQGKLRMAKLYSLTDQSELGKQMIRDQLPHLRRRQDFNLLQAAYAGLANIAQKEKQMDDAIQYANQALQAAEQNGVSKPDLQAAHLLCSSIYEAAGAFEEALLHQKAYHAYSDSIFTDNAQQKLKEEQVRQQVDEQIKQKEQAEAYAQLLKRQNIAYLIASLFLILLLSLGTYLLVQLRETRALLQNQNQSLQQLNQTKDRFFSIIAHDLRSPLVALESVDQQMKYYLDKGDQSKVQKIASLVGKTSQQLSALLDNLLNWARQQIGVIPYHPEELSIAEAFDQVETLYESAARQKNVLISKESDPTIKVFADKNALLTILRNLLSNALKFSQPGGQIRLKAATTENQVRIHIIDDGEGMTPEQLEHVFHLDKKSSIGTRGEQGTGLGLVLCKDLTEQNHGSINVLSRKGDGTEIIVSLPAKPAS